MSAPILSEKQRVAAIEAFKSGTTREELRLRFGCNRRTITRLLISAGLERPVDPWDDAITSRLKELLAEKKEKKHSMDQIATMLNKEFKTSYSKNAVCGKVARLGLGGVKVVSAPKPKRVHAFKPPPPKPIAPKRVASPLPTPPSMPEATVDSSDALNVTLRGLEDGMCKWPTGDDAYCGHATGGKRVIYCAKHHNAGVTQPANYRGFWGSKATRR